MRLLCPSSSARALLSRPTRRTVAGEPPGRASASLPSTSCPEYQGESSAMKTRTTTPELASVGACSSSHAMDVEPLVSKSRPGKQLPMELAVDLYPRVSLSEPRRRPPPPAAILVGHRICRPQRR